ncbi:MAG: class I SAM-dependent methyltransferase [Leptospira sp.]|nr:class I SAM-dependent methyltransferase [Leptospira sp.]
MVCRNTGTFLYLKARKRSYNAAYFMADYKKQYKKTYYEDESNLRMLANNRLDILEKFSIPPGKTILEIGCAAGFFLDEARKRGYQVSGIEPSGSEVRFARSIGLDVKKCFLNEYHTDKKFDIICAFFVIEHIQKQEEALFHINSLLKEDGLLFLALPSVYGPSFQTNSSQWFNTHPDDHFFDYSPASIEKVLGLFGMKILYKRPLSYHQVRDLRWRGKLPGKSLYKTLADMTCYGDTFQIAAKKHKI